MHVVGHCNILFVGLEGKRSCFEIERGCWRTCFKFTRIEQGVEGVETTWCLRV
jgi:hypothetical protein